MLTSILFYLPQQGLTSVQMLVYSNYDSVSAAGKHYAVLVYADAADTQKTSGNLVLAALQKGIVTTTDTVRYDDSNHYYMMEVGVGFSRTKFEDLNNDGVKDIIIYTGSGGRGANEFFRLYLVNPITDKLVPLTPSKDDNTEGIFVNPYYDKTTRTLMTSAFYGDNIAMRKYKIRGFKIKSSHLVVDKPE